MKCFSFEEDGGSSYGCMLSPCGSWCRNIGYARPDFVREYGKRAVRKSQVARRLSGIIVVPGGFASVGEWLAERPKHKF